METTPCGPGSDIQTPDPVSRSGTKLPVAPPVLG